MIKNNKVLIVEDRSITALDLSLVLKKLGYTTMTAKSGEEAIEIFSNEKPDLILMDIMLKGYYTGLEAAGLIRHQSNVPIIFITALNDDETILKAHMTENSVILVKPYNELLLKKTVERIRQGELLTV